MTAYRFQETSQVWLENRDADRENSIIFLVKHTFRQQIEHNNVTKSAAIKVISTKSSGPVSHLIPVRRTSRAGAKITTGQLKQRSQLMRTSLGNCTENDTKIGYIPSSGQRSQVQLVKRLKEIKTNIPEELLLYRIYSIKVRSRSMSDSRSALLDKKQNVRLIMQC